MVPLGYPVHTPESCFALPLASCSRALGRGAVQAGARPQDPHPAGAWGSGHSAEWPAAAGAQLNMAVARVGRQAAAQVSSVRAGESVAARGARRAPPLLSTSLLVAEGP